MAGPTIQQFDLDPQKLAAFQACIDNYDVGEPTAEWPNNMLSKRTVVYASGVIARVGEPVEHDVDPDELALCRRLAGEAVAVMDGNDVGMGSEATDPFHEFFVVANVGAPVPEAIDDDLIRTRFGGTLFPPVTIKIEPLEEAGVWWSEVTEWVAEEEEEDQEAYLIPWRGLIAWFQTQPDFIDSAFIRIGDSEDLWDWNTSRNQREQRGGEGADDEYPPGTEMAPCVLPRLALGLTKNGSLVGIFGHVVHT